MTIRVDVEKYILKLTNEAELDHSMNLFELGTLTSIDVLDVLSFLEETFNISVSDEDISMENFGSINGIVNLVEKLRRSG